MAVTMKVMMVVMVMAITVASGLMPAGGTAPPSNQYWTAYFDPDTSVYSVAPRHDPVNGGTYLPLVFFKIPLLS